MKALLSVYDKEGIVDFGRKLDQLGYELVSTGGTHRQLSDNGLPVQQVSDLTGFPEILGGRVKTLHPKIHGGILARRHLQEDLDELNYHGIGSIDVVVSNLYPFRDTIARENVSLDEALENIDIGGPTLIRAASKNFPSVVVVVDPKDYSWIADKMGSGGLSFDERRIIAGKAFQHVAFYDTAIAQYIGARDGEDFPQELTIGLEKIQDLRYGENPHQKAAFYMPSLKPSGMARAHQIQGKGLSFNNLLDASAAWSAVSDFPEQAVAIIKHTNPCGLAVHSDISEAYSRAYQGDTVSAYGGIVAFNGNVTSKVAEDMASVFYEVIIAPSYDMDALSIFKKKKNLRILSMQAPEMYSHLDVQVKQILGGFLMQSIDRSDEDTSTWKVVTEIEPIAQQMSDMIFGWRVVRHLKSNAIVIAKDNMLLGMGAGQPNRVTSVRLAAQAAGKSSKGAILASDAMFPFPDNVEEAANAGVSAIIQPGGSIRDDDVIQAANRLGLSMVFTGTRHFLH